MTILHDKSTDTFTRPILKWQCGNPCIPKESWLEVRATLPSLPTRGPRTKCTPVTAAFTSSSIGRTSPRHSQQTETSPPLKTTMRHFTPKVNLKNTMNPRQRLILITTSNRVRDPVTTTKSTTNAIHTDGMPTWPSTTWPMGGICRQIVIRNTFVADRRS